MTNPLTTNTETIDGRPSECARLRRANEELLDALITALPFVETAEVDLAYKPGVVAKVTKQMRAAIANATKDEADDR